MEKAIVQEIGAKIRYLRKKKGLSLEQLAGRVGKCRSMVCKYELGTATMDLLTLYEIADALGTPVEELLYRRAEQKRSSAPAGEPVTFFNNAARFYGYYFDGRIQALNRSVFDITGSSPDGGWNISMYMNISDYQHYQDCENTYRGIIEHHASITTIHMKNIGTTIEWLGINVLSNFQDNAEKWGVMYGVSSRPLMPIALKILLTEKPAAENEDFLKKLKISKYDISLMRQFNMFTVMPTG